MSPQAPKIDPQVMATTLTAVVQDTIQKMGSLPFSKDPEFFQKEIIEHESRMRVFGLEKFNDSCYISVVNYYLTQNDMEDHNAVGTFILYMEEDAATKILKALGYTGFSDEDEDLVMDHCAEFCNIIAEKFKSALVGLGFKDLVISAPSNHKNDIHEGVEFPYSEYGMHEAHFFIWKKKALVVGVVLGSAA